METWPTIDLPEDFTTECDALEATRNGMFGGPADPYQVLVPGVMKYYVKGERVSPEEFLRRAEAVEARQRTSGST